MIASNVCTLLFSILFVKAVGQIVPIKAGNEINRIVQRLDADIDELKDLLQIYGPPSQDGDRRTQGIDCLDMSGTFGYSGTISRTRSGKHCQDWSSQSPNKHAVNTSDKFPLDGSVSNAKNYCRDPDREGMPWCYTTDSQVRWEFCPIPVCNEDCWYGTKSRLFVGKRTITVSGRTCQEWAKQTPHRHTNAEAERFPFDASLEDAKNYCRDPDKSGKPWCYTTDRNTRWEYCYTRCED